MSTSKAQTQSSRANWLPGTAVQQGGWSVALGAAIWGLFWIPLRFLDDHGVNGLWAVSMVMWPVTIPPLLLLLTSGRLNLLQNKNAWFIGAALGTSTVLYFIAVMVSDVIRVVFLFYLLPVWTTIAARFIYQEKISVLNFLVIALALAGLWLLLGGGSQLPLPTNIGDWCGLLAGFCWGVSLALLRGIDEVDATATVATTGISAGVISVVFAFALTLLGAQQIAGVPVPDSWLLVSGAAVAFSVLLLFPSLISQIWGAQRIAAPTAALLTMSEILVATLSAYLLIGTELSRLSMLGAFIILCAVFMDIRVKYRAGRHKV